MSTQRRKFSSDKVIEEFYDTLADGRQRMELVHIPKSDVFYARRAYFEYSGDWVTLDRMERAMYLEGMLDRSDVLDPDKKRDWEP